MSHFGLIAAGAALVVSAGAAAQGYPTKPVRVIAPFAAGSGTDIVARIVSEELRVALGANFVVDNRAGGSGQIAAELVAKAAPDGYTLMVSTNTPHSANPFLFKKLNYDPVRDFTPVSKLIHYLFVVAVNPALPIKTPQELVSFIKSNPGKVQYAHGNSTGQVAGAYFTHAGKFDALAVPYKSTPPAMTDMIGGQVHYMFVDWAASQGHIKGGRLRAIAVMSDKRSTILPELPPIGDAVPGFDMVPWAGSFSAAGTPKAVVDRLDAEIRKIMDKPAVRERMIGLGLEPAYAGPAEFGAFVKGQLKAWGDKIRAAGIQPE